MTVHICQKPLNCTLKVGAFIASKLYLKITVGKKGTICNSNNKCKVHKIKHI